MIRNWRKLRQLYVIGNNLDGDMNLGKVRTVKCNKKRLEIGKSWSGNMKLGEVCLCIAN